MLNLAPGQRLLNRFTLQERLGAGGHGEVWRALDEQRDGPVALKVLYPHLARSGDLWGLLLREYELAQRLHHPGILEIYEPLRDDEHTVLPMQLAAGDLRQLRGESYLRIVPMLLEVAAALKHAHANGIVHRDLKPANVLIDAEGCIKLADFSAARLAGVSDRGTAASPFSASPQQLAGAEPTVADDIYGLGALAYELLSGYPPHYPHFDRRRIAEEPVPPLHPVHPVPPRLEALVMRMLAKDPLARPASMDEVTEGLYAGLQDTLEDITSAAQPAPVSEPELPRIDEPENVTADLGGRIATPLPPAAPAPSSTVSHPRRGLWWIGLTAAAALLVAVFAWLPQYAARRTVTAGPEPPPSSGAAEGAAAQRDDQSTADERAAAAAEFARRRAAFESLLAQLEAQQAAAWADASFAAGKSLGADSVAAYEAGRLDIALDRIAVAQKRLQKVAEQAPAALRAQLASGERALQEGQLP
ncbi:MAG: serine/threonine protein kinase, partial [Steroidobacteraceae bacterium]|nr:serine/threonine protein kinase [Steroidobacteraceae bacterium]MDW8260245.1 serine/threonine-protein kinase [Gammaproteobacteria bacterium]